MKIPLANRHASSAAQPRISVAMATFNGEKHIQEQLDSIARQTLLPIELVITDDGSTDKTLNIVDSFAVTAPFPVSIFQNETRLGYADNFLKAASLCSGDLIAFCDQDDVWMKEKLNSCSGYFADASVLLVAHSALTVFNSGKTGRRVPQFKHTRVSTFCDPLVFALGFATIIRKELLTFQISLRPSKLLGHDQWLWFLAASAGQIATVSDVLTLYRQHQSNLFGAAPHRTISARARNIAETVHYDERATFEMECSQILRILAAQHPMRAPRLKESAERLAFRSRFHSFRTCIYRADSTLPNRVRAFMNIFLSGGYLPDSSGTRLGPRAAVKDLLVGLPRIHRLFLSRDRSHRRHS